MYHLVNNLTNKSGDALVGYFVKLKDADGNYATLYSDTNSTPIATVSGIANAGITDSTGMYDIYVADGTYDVEFFDKSDITQLVTRIPAVPMFSNTSTEAVFAVLASTGSGEGAAKVAYTNGLSGAVDDTLDNRVRKEVLLTDYIPVSEHAAIRAGTSTYDCTSAFNAATEATAAWSASLEKTIVVPYGTYVVDGTVYIRNGQTLDFRGAIIDASSNTDVIRFALGRGLIAGTPTTDASGPPVKVYNLRGNGGSGNFGFLTVYCQGFVIESPFLSSPGVGIAYASGAADGHVNNAIIDQALVGIAADGCQNIIHSGLKCYVAATAIQIGDSARNIVFSGGVVAYSSIASVYFADSAANIRRITFDGLDFVTNAQNAGTFNGHIRNRAVGPDAKFTGCTFSNWYEYCVKDEAGAGMQVDFNACTFDGQKSANAYTQGTTAKVLTTLSGGRYNFNGCQFRNLLGALAHVVNGVAGINLRGGEVLNCVEDRFTFGTTIGNNPHISVKGVKGFAFVKNTATHQAIVLPYWGDNTAWDVAVQASPIGSNGRYGMWRKAVVSAVYMFVATSQRIYFDKTGELTLPTRVIPDVTTSPLSVCTGTAPGGAADIAAPADNYGKMCVSLPIATADASNVNWSVDTLI